VRAWSIIDWTMVAGMEAAAGPGWTGLTTS